MLTKVCIVKSLVSPVVMYGWDSWTINKAERQRVDAFELWCWRRLLRVPWYARGSNQSILKEISPEYLLKGLILKLKLQYCYHLMGRANSLEKTLMLGKIEGKRRRGWQRIRRLDGITNSIDMLLSLFSCSVVSYSLWSHELQYTKLPCPSPRICSNSYPLGGIRGLLKRYSQWTQAWAIYGR